MSTDPRNRHEDEVNNLKSIYNYWQDNGEYDETAQEYVESTAADINWRELQEKLSGASDLDESRGREERE